MSENSGQQLLVKARFNFQQTNEDELTFNKGDIINVTRQEEGGWWEGTLSGKTGWFPSNYVREVKGTGRCHRNMEEEMLCLEITEDVLIRQVIGLLINISTLLSPPQGDQKQRHFFFKTQLQCSDSSS